MIYKHRAGIFKPLKRWETDTQRLLGWSIGELDERGFCQRVRQEVYKSEEKCKVEIEAMYPGGEWHNIAYLT